MNPIWQQIKLREYCNRKGILVTAYSPLGGQDAKISRNLVQQSNVLKEIADARGKTVAQVIINLPFRIKTIFESFSSFPNK